MPFGLKGSGEDDSNPLDHIKPEKDPNEKSLRALLRGDTETRLRLIEEAEEKEVGKSVTGFLKNVGQESSDIIKGLGILGYKAGSGAAKLAGKALTRPVDTYDDVVSGKAWDTLSGALGNFGKAIAHDYKDRYGPLLAGDWDEAADRLYDKPLSFLLDATSALSLAGGSARLLAKPFAEAAAGRALTSTGTALTKLGQTLDPLYITKAGLKKAGELAPTLPVIGKNAVQLRQLKKTNRDIVLEEMELGKRESEIQQAKVMSKYNALTTAEKEKIHHYLWGWEELPSTARPELKEAVEWHRQYLTRPEHIDDLGIVSEEARRRTIAPAILKKFYDGELKFSPETEALLAEGGFIQPGSALEGVVEGATARGRELRFPGGLMDVPEQLFKEAESQLTAAERGAVYFPAIEAEAKLAPDRFIFRTGPTFTNIKSGFQKPFTGEVVNRVLRSKDPGVLAESEHVIRQYINDTQMARAMKKIDERLMGLTDPRTGQSMAKKLYLGRTPNNLLAFDNGKDMAKVVNAMEKPLRGSVDEVYREAVGVSREAMAAKIKKTNPSFSLRAAENAADDLMLQRLSEKGHDGFIVTKGDGTGRYGFVNPSQNPFGGLQDNHVIYAPQGLMRFFKSQEKLASNVRGKLEAENHLEQAAYNAVREVFPEGDELFNAAKKEYEAAGKQGLEMLNTEYLNPAQLSKAVKDFRAALKTTLKGTDINPQDAARALKSYSTRVNHIPGRGTLSVAKNNWVYQIPKEVAEEIQSLYRPLFAGNNLNTSFKLFFDSPTSAWRMIALNLTPRWQVNNFLGNAALNMVAGVLNPIDYARALPFMMYRMANRFPRGIGLPAQKILDIAGIKGDRMAKLAETTENFYRQVGMGTFFKSETYPIHLGQAAETPMGKIQSSIANSLVGRGLQKAAVASADFNSIVDQFFRDANLISKIRGQIRKESTSKLKKITSSFFASEDEIYKYVNNPNNATLKELASKVDEFLPNYQKLLNPVEKRFIRRIFPFYSWYKHMVGVTLMMPIKHPVRARLVSHITKFAKDVEDQEWVENGIDPKDVRLIADYLDGSVLLSKKNDVAKFLSTRGANPFNSILEIKNVGNLLNPGIKFILEEWFEKDLFKMKDFSKKIHLNNEGIPVETTDMEYVRRVLDLIPNASAVKRIINPDTVDEEGQIVFTRDRQLEALKLLGVNIQEREIAPMMEKAAKLKGKNAAKAVNKIIKSKRSDSEELIKLLDRVKELRN